MHGDTFDTTTEGRVRLADIDAPEYYEPGYDDARDFLISLIGGKTLYLDIDDKYRTDPYDRLGMHACCVVYIKYNSTHYQNINQALLNAGVAEISDYDNEFDPYAWVLYVHAPARNTIRKQWGNGICMLLFYHGSIDDT
jgi:endonuclease YncB( thermonuclease family)